MPQLQTKIQHAARIVGAGSFVPSRVIDNHRISKAISGWDAERIEEKTCIQDAPLPVGFR